MANLLAEILKHSEGKTLEYKRDLSSMKPVLKTLVSFANTSGGTVVIGVDDKKAVSGVSDPEMDEERLSSAVADDISPVLLPDIEIVRDEGKAVIVVKVARFPGTEKVDFIDRLDIEGTVLEALTEVPKFIRRNTRMAAKIAGMQRQDIPEYPVIALREALTNAVAHTDYALRGMQIMIAIFADRLEIQNPGMLPFGMTLDDLKSGVSKIRNPVIARVLRELDYMEKWGTGYKRIMEDCDSGGYPHPEWQELSTVMRVKFQQIPIKGETGAEPGKLEQIGTKSALSRHQVQLLEFMKEPRSLRELMTLLGWTDRTKFRNKFIKPLLDQDLIKMTVPDRPTSRNQKYYAAEN